MSEMASRYYHYAIVRTGAASYRMDGGDPDEERGILVKEGDVIEIANADITKFRLACVGKCRVDVVSSPVRIDTWNFLL